MFFSEEVTAMSLVLTPPKLFIIDTTFVKVSMSVAMRDGESQEFPTALVGRKDTQDGQSRVSSSFSLSQIPPLIRLLAAAYDEMLQMEGRVSDDLRERLTGGKKSPRSKRSGVGSPEEPQASAGNGRHAADGPASSAP
jgi:hypothetical protein